MPDLRLQLFVYGTLKRGQRSHLRFCGGADAIEPALILGQLYHLPAGYPMLCVPQVSILAVGTSDPAADLATQQKFAALPHAPAPETGSPADPGADPNAEQDWEPIKGELLSFADPSDVLQSLDWFEDFRPGCADTSYIRALVRTLGDKPAHVWTYVAPGGKLPSGATRVHRCWP
jgi:gamma-glutamylcyclotransferase (GGCT)/AIG2-like uncharacterized protein YtfP